MIALLFPIFLALVIADKLTRRWLNVSVDKNDAVATGIFPLLPALFWSFVCSLGMRESQMLVECPIIYFVTAWIAYLAAFSNKKYSIKSPVVMAFKFVCINFLVIAIVVAITLFVYVLLAKRFGG